MDTIKTHMQSYCAQCPVGNGNDTKKNNRMATMMRGSGNNIPQQTSSSSVVSRHQLGMWGTFRDLIGLNTSSTKALQQHTTTPSRLLVTTSIEASSTSTTTAAISTINTTGILRLWRGVQTMAIGCIPAHALYFSCYEATKHTLHPSGDTVASAVAGATATISHDIIMAPLDTIKQRLQLGHYDGRFFAALSNMYKVEGMHGLFRSFPITLFTNVPYGVVMVSTNDFLKSALQPSLYGSDGEHTKYKLSTCLLAGSAAGCVASALTTPLDRVKTRLQTQALGITKQSLPDYCNISASSSCPKQQAIVVHLKYNGIKDAFLSIVKEEGWVGLFRGLTPRVCAHTPAVALSWTAYEMAKNWLAQL